MCCITIHFIYLSLTHASNVDASYCALFHHISRSSLDGSLIHGCSCMSSISNGTSGWERGEGSAQSQALHHYSEGGARVHTCRGEASSCRTHPKNCWIAHDHQHFSFIVIFSMCRKWRPSLRTTTVRKLSAWSLHTTTTGTLHSNRTRMLNRWVFEKCNVLSVCFAFLFHCLVKYRYLIGFVCLVQAHRYLREEVKTFQGKPIMASWLPLTSIYLFVYFWQLLLEIPPYHLLMTYDLCLQARIKAINTFFAKNGYRNLDCSMYSQQTQTQSQYSSPLFMQHVYSPQQPYLPYNIVPPTWTPSPTPYFETPLVCGPVCACWCAVCVLGFWLVAKNWSACSAVWSSTFYELC